MTTQTTYGDHIVIPWLQAAEEYKKRVAQLFYDIKHDTRIIFENEQFPAFFFAEPGGDFLFNLNINEAQNSFIDNKEFFLLPPSYQVPNQEDGHPTGNGYRWFGEQIGKTLQAVVLNNNTPENLNVSSFSFDGKNKISLAFNIPQKPIFLDTWTLAKMKNYGFAIVADGQERSILDVRCDGELIMIVTEDLSNCSSIFVEYASEKSVGESFSNIKGAGNVCDSSNQQSYFKNVENLGTSGSVEYEPKDKEGNVLVGKNYPLNNFLHAFNLRIK